VDADHAAGIVEDHEAGAGGALVDCADVSGHDFLASRMLGKHLGSIRISGASQAQMYLGMNY
jgi:hypothetical protein